MFTKSFWLAAIERSVKTFAQAAGALIAGGGLGVLTVNWGDVFSVAALAAIASVLTSLVSAPIGPVGSPSVVQDDKAVDNPGATR
jgi:hypothetical protein